MRVTTDNNLWLSSVTNIFKLAYEVFLIKNVFPLTDRYGREDLDVLGLTFRKDLFLVCKD